MRIKVVSYKNWANTKADKMKKSKNKGVKRHNNQVRKYKYSLMICHMHKWIKFSDQTVLSVWEVMIPRGLSPVNGLIPIIKGLEIESLISLPFFFLLLSVMGWQQRHKKSL